MTELGTYEPKIGELEQKLAELQECCKDNKIFIFRQMSQINVDSRNKKYLSPYEENFTLNNLDFLIQNYKNISDEEGGIITKLTIFIIWILEEPILNRFNEEKLQKIINFEINGRYKGNIKLFEEQLEHHQVRADRKKTYDTLKKIIEKIKEEKTKEDGKRKRSVRNKKRKSIKKANKRRSKNF